MKIFRHGDLLLVEVSQLPNEAKKTERSVLLEGEASNHFHRISGATVYEIPEEPVDANNYTLGYLTVEKEAKLTHEEHNAIEIPAGIYKFLCQREYDPQENRRVRD